MRSFLPLLLLASLSAAAAEPPFCLKQGVPPGSLESPPGMCFAPFEGRVQPLDEARRAAMTPSVWREGCPVGPENLRLVQAVHWTLEGEVARGEIVVAASQAEKVLEVLRQLWQARFPLARMSPVELFEGSDERSMAANNSSAFNCRALTRGKGFSRHSFGEAIDLNPLQNPWVRGDQVLPPEGRPWASRTRLEPGVIVAEGAAVKAFESIGWKWGGRWKHTKDWQHFSSDGR